MRKSSILTYRQRLQEIVNQAYIVLYNKIAGKDIVVNNEASMQMQFGTLLKYLGLLYEFSPIDHFHIELETSEDISETAKSKNGAKCDIKLSFFRGRESTPRAVAYIELKHFKIPMAKTSNESTSSNRFGVLMDIENLERYQDELREGNGPKPLCFEIVFAENSTYYHSKGDNNYDIGHGVKNKTQYSYRGETVSLRGRYEFKWDVLASNQYWLKVSV